MSFPFDLATVNNGVKPIGTDTRFYKHYPIEDGTFVLAFSGEYDRETDSFADIFLHVRAFELNNPEEYSRGNCLASLKSFVPVTDVTIGAAVYSFVADFEMPIVVKGGTKIEVDFHNILSFTIAEPIHLRTGGIVEAGKRVILSKMAASGWVVTDNQRKIVKIED